MTLSPKSNASKFGSTCKSLKIDNTVTGSVALTIAPNCKQCEKPISFGAKSVSFDSCRAIEAHPAMQKVDIVVPIRATQQ